MHPVARRSATILSFAARTQLSRFFPGYFMARDQTDTTPLQSRDDLVAWFEAGIKPKSEFRIGTEHEKTPFTVSGHHPVPYEGPRGIGALLEGMRLLLGWEPIMERGNIIGLHDVTGGGAISLEPGGQFELSGAPLETVHQTQAELMAHLAQVREVAAPLGIRFLGLGMTPSWSRLDTISFGSWAWMGFALMAKTIASSTT